MKRACKRHFECLMNEMIQRKTIVSSMGVEAGGKNLNVQKKIGKK